MTEPKEKKKSTFKFTVRLEGKAPDALNLIRYKNRKLYSQDEHRYVGYVEILERVQKGEDVTIVDKGTKKDVTSKVLLTAMNEYGEVPVEVLIAIIRGGRVPL